MPAIEVNNLQKFFGKTRAVDDISFSVAKGEIFGFLGPNGAGKTTTIRCLMDFIRPTAGGIKIIGLDAQKDTVELKKKIGYLSGGAKLYNRWTGQDHIDFYKKLNGRHDSSAKLASRLDLDVSLKAKQLSSGNRQKLAIVLALMQAPEILILDEPTLALDPLLQNQIYELLEDLSKNGTTIFMSSHNLGEVDRICHRVGIIKQGKMVATEGIRSLKEKRIHSIHVYFEDKYDKKDFLMEGVSIVKELPDALILTLKGDINILIRALNKYHLKGVEITPASLEDIFMEYYE